MVIFTHNTAKKILIIDDEKAIRKTLTEILGFEGYKIDEAADGEEGEEGAEGEEGSSAEGSSDASAE